MSIHIFDTVFAWRAALADLRAGGRSIGFVPTMGALHEGHAQLCRRAASENGAAVASIFVNPTQFDNPWDFENYPKTLDADLAILEATGVTHALVPRVEEMYPDRRTFVVSETETSRILEGAHRPGHFEGMLTIVLKLLNATQADRAYFGEKDWQQLHLVRRLVSAFFIPTEIVPCPTIRESDGLAMSSRNRRLSPEERALAARFPEILRTAPDCAAAAARLRELGFEVDYVDEWDGRRLGAVRLGKTRLIDNIPAP
jgi:pantoate--beta-alanine ligase